MTNAQKIQKAQELEAKADALYMSLLAPSMREDAMRDEAKRLRAEVSATLWRAKIDHINAARERLMK